MAGLSAISCSRFDRVHNLLCCCYAGRLCQCVFTHGTKVRRREKPGSYPSLNLVWQINGDPKLWITLRNASWQQVGINDTHSFWSAQFNVGGTTPFTAHCAYSAQKCEKRYILLPAYISCSPTLLFAELHDTVRHHST